MEEVDSGLLPDISWWGTLTRLKPFRLYACLTSLQLRALLSAAADDSISISISIHSEEHEASCSFHIAYICEPSCQSRGRESEIRRK